MFCRRQGLEETGHARVSPLQLPADAEGAAARDMRTVPVLPHPGDARPAAAVGTLLPSVARLRRIHRAPARERHRRQERRLRGDRIPSARRPRRAGNRARRDPGPHEPLKGGWLVGCGRAEARPSRARALLAHSPHRLHDLGQDVRARAGERARARVRQALEEGARRPLAAHAAQDDQRAGREGNRCRGDHRLVGGGRTELDRVLPRGVRAPARLRHPSVAARDGRLHGGFGRRDATAGRSTACAASRRRTSPRASSGWDATRTGRRARPRPPPTSTAARRSPPRRSPPRRRRAAGRSRRTSCA